MHYRNYFFLFLFLVIASCHREASSSIEQQQSAKTENSNINEFKKTLNEKQLYKVEKDANSNGKVEKVTILEIE